MQVRSPSLVRDEPRIAFVCASPSHEFSKRCLPKICLLAGIGVEGDAHAGVTIKHRSRVAVDPTQPNLRQVHVIASELHDELRRLGFRVDAGTMGENVTTVGIDLLALPVDTLLRLGPDAVIRLTGLRNPCAQLDAFQKGLVAAVLGRDADGNLVRKAGVMAVVVAAGIVKPGDAIGVSLPAVPHRRLERI